MKALFYSIFMLFVPFLGGAQSPYALIGSDKQSGGPVGWTGEASFDEIISKVMDTWAMDDEFMGSVLVARNGQTMISKGFGKSNRSFNVPATSETKYLIGYASFHFARYGLAQLVASGQVSLGSAISDILPELTNLHFKQITVLDIVQFRSGLNESLEGVINLDSRHDLNQLLAVIDSLPLINKPGTAYSFGWSSPVIMASIIERKLDIPFQEYVQHHIMNQLEMSNTGFMHDKMVISELATPYMYFFNDVNQANKFNPECFGPFSSMYSTVIDSYKFYNHVSQWIQTSNQSVKTVMGIRQMGISEGSLTDQPNSLSAEYAFELLDTNGWFNGFTSLVTCFTDSQTMIIILSNKFRATEIYDIRRRFTRLMHELPVGLPLPKTRRTIWKTLEDDGPEATAQYYNHFLEAGYSSIPLRDEFMFLSREARKRGMLKKALEVSQLFVEIDAKWVAYRELGEVYKLMGEIDKAKESFRMSLSLNPTNPNWKLEMEQYIQKE